MWIQFTRNRLRRILDAIINGRPIASPADGRFWPDSDLLAVAGCCLAEIMRRRDYVNASHTDYHLAGEIERAHGSLSHRLHAAVVYAVNTASNFTNGAISRSPHAEGDGELAFTVEIRYEKGTFHPRRRPAAAFPPDANRMPPGYRGWESAAGRTGMDVGEAANGHENMAGRDGAARIDDPDRLAGADAPIGRNGKRPAVGLATGRAMINPPFAAAR